MLQSLSNQKMECTTQDVKLIIEFEQANSFLKEMIKEYYSQSIIIFKKRNKLNNAIELIIKYSKEKNYKLLVQNVAHENYNFALYTFTICNTILKCTSVGIKKDLSYKENSKTGNRTTLSYHTIEALLLC